MFTILSLFGLPTVLATFEKVWPMFKKSSGHPVEAAPFVYACLSRTI
jgi:hypothetical protein